jgi:adenine phosphoribosyltransferase
MKDLKGLIRSIPDFPKKGIVFRDITPLLADADGFKQAVEAIAKRFKAAKPEMVVGVEARGFIIGPAVALKLGAGFIPVRKPGKLPYKTRSASYQLEYGTDKIEIHADAVQPGQKVLIVDDLLATGGTAAATCDLVETMGGKIVGCAFLIELGFLNGREKLKKHDVFTLIDYKSEAE